MIRPILLGAALLTLLAFGSAAETQAQSASEIQQKINDHSRQIEALQAEIAGYQKQVDALGKQKDTLQSAIDSLALSQKQLAAQISVTQNKIGSANLELQQLGVAIGDKEATIKIDREAIAKALREIARGEREPLIERMVGAESLAGAWQAAEAATQFNRALGEDITELRAVREQLAEDRDAVATAKEKLEKLQKDLTFQKKSVDLNKAAQQKLLVDTKSQESTYQKLLAEKRAEEAAFEAALFDLASQLEYILDPSKIPPAGKGGLRWPVDNVFVTQQFG